MTLMRVVSAVALLSGCDGPSTVDELCAWWPHGETLCAVLRAAGLI